jgi:hypothetical protein
MNLVEAVVVGMGLTVVVLVKLVGVKVQVITPLH